MKKRKLGIVGPSGEAIYSEDKPLHHSCAFCGIRYESGVVLVVSANGKAAICDGCLGASINYMKVQYGYKPDLKRGCWVKIEEQEHPLAIAEEPKIDA